MNIDVILSPALSHLYNFNNKIVIVIDIFRATSTICTAVANGVNEIVVSDNIEETQNRKKFGYLTAGERNGQKIDGFDIGNSPFECLDEKVKDKKIAFTTTNGTKIIKISEENQCDQIWIGSFLNISRITKEITSQNKDVLLFCAGWKDLVNIEDMLFAGAVLHKLNYQNPNYSDSVFNSIKMYELAKDNLVSFLKDSSHYQRLSKFSHEEDMIFCLKEDLFPVLPICKSFVIKI